MPLRRKSNILPSSRSVSSTYDSLIGSTWLIDHMVDWVNSWLAIRLLTNFSGGVLLHVTRLVKWLVRWSIAFVGWLDSQLLTSFLGGRSFSTSALMRRSMNGRRMVCSFLITLSRALLSVSRLHVQTQIQFEVKVEVNDKLKLKSKSKSDSKTLLKLKLKLKVHLKCNSTLKFNLKFEFHVSVQVVAKNYMWS